MVKYNSSRMGNSWRERRTNNFPVLLRATEEEEEEDDPEGALSIIKLRLFVIPSRKSYW